MPEFVVQPLLQSATVAAYDVHCRGECRHRGAEECAAETHLVFPYRGLFMRHVGSTQSVADANHVLFFNGGEGYRVSHPASGGDACLSVSISQPLLQELAPASLLQHGDAPMFRSQSLRRSFPRHRGAGARCRVAHAHHRRTQHLPAHIYR